jgi:leucyl aminopeptidase
MPTVFAAPCDFAIAVHVVDQVSLEDWLKRQPEHVAHWMQANGFKASIGQALLVPGAEASAPEIAVVGYGTAAQRARQRFVLAAGASKLPDGTYKLAEADEDNAIPQNMLQQECFGWLMTGYAFGRYKEAKGSGAALIAPKAVDAKGIESLVAAECLTRDLINTPAADMGPDQLQAAAERLSQEFGATTEITLDKELLAQNLPMIHAVGRAAEARPRLIDMRWGKKGPKLTLVGKGVCFDTGGLNLKPGASMGLMKKDMGGAATVLGLAHMIMGLGLKLRLRVLVPAVENSVSGNSFRPGDILNSRKGLTVEINNTDAEGRLVLADALALGAEGAPDLMLSMATLTGAARVAVGPDLSPFFTDDEGVAAALQTAGAKVADPVWRLPFWDPYEADIEPGIADLDNAPKGGFGGAITAALFLRRFAGDQARYTHFDIYGWSAKNQPARPLGGVGMGARALLQALPDMLEL